MSREAVGLPDLLRALGILRPKSERSRQAVARSLGYELAGTAEDAAEVLEPAAREPLPKPRASEPSPAPIAPVQTESHERRFRLRATRRVRRAFSSYVIAPPRAAAIPAGGPEDKLPPPRFEPLFEPRWSRAMISTMARIRSYSGPPHVDDLVKIAAERKPAVVLPASTVDGASGVDVLIDVGDRMMMFGRDQRDLLSRIRRVVGEGRLVVYRFRDSPRGGVLCELDVEENRYQPPLLPRPVVALTDVGAGAGSAAARMAIARDWAQFADHLRTTGSRLLALVPYPPRRWPEGLSSTIDIVQWDRCSNIRALRRLLKRTR